MTLRMVLAEIVWRPVETYREQLSMIKIADLRLCGWFWTLRMVLAKTPWIPSETSKELF